jgi:hypothetical protein
MSLVDKIRKARETGVEVEGFRFTIRRPTDQEAISLKGASFIEISQRFVVGWSGVKEVDIVPGGDGVEVAFDAEVWKEWCADNPNFWGPVANAVLASYNDHCKARNDTKKKQ